jgi:hypothetical protein
MTEFHRVRIIWTIIFALSALSFVGLSSLCLTLFYKNYADPAVLTAIISITSGVVGSLGTLAIGKPATPSTPDQSSPPPPPPTTPPTT